MARAHITFRKAIGVGGAALASRTPRVAETINTTATSAQSTITAEYLDVATIVATGGSVFIAVGSNPTAVSSAGDLIPDGGRLELSGMVAGDKIAAIDA